MNSADLFTSSLRYIYMFYGGRCVRTIGATWHRVLAFENSVLLMTFSPENVNGWSLSVYSKIDQTMGS